ncbi:MAG: hypothetical protein GYA15_03965 [Leptolinea sp.]|jgi:hypothetical protein|nr:hypothetical protein [Leptolinea sp.]
MESEYLEKIWGEILSRRPARIRHMFDTLDTSSQQEVIRHLKRMVSEEGWQEPQIVSARAALSALKPDHPIDHD